MFACTCFIYIFILHIFNLCSYLHILHIIYIKDTHTSNILTAVLPHQKLVLHFYCSYRFRFHWFGRDPTNSKFLKCASMILTCGSKTTILCFSNTKARETVSGKGHKSHLQIQCSLCPTTKGRKDKKSKYHR